MSTEDQPDLYEMAEHVVYELGIERAFTTDSADTAEFSSIEREEDFDWQWLNIAEVEFGKKKLRLIFAISSGAKCDLFPWLQNAKGEKRRAMRQLFPKLLKKVDGWMVGTLAGYGENEILLYVVKKERWLAAGSPRILNAGHHDDEDGEAD